MTGQAELRWELRRPEDRKRWWIRETLYTLEPRTPLSEGVFNSYWDEAVLWIAEKMSIPDTRGFNIRTVNGYTYLGPLEITDQALVQERAKVFQARIQKLIQDVEVDFPRHRDAQASTLATWRHVDLAAQTTMELLESWRRVVLALDRFFKVHFLIVFPRHVLTGMLAEFARTASGIENPAEVGKLTQSMGTTRQLQLDMALWGLADDAIRRGLRETFLGRTAGELKRALPEDPRGREWWPRLADFLGEYGGRLIVPKELSSRTWQEDPAPVLETIRTYIALGGTFDFDRLMRQQAAERERTLQAALARIQSAEEEQRFERMAGLAQRLQANMEDDNFFLLQMGGYTRRVAVEVGRRLAAAGVLRDLEDVFFLYKDEVESFLVDAVAGAYDLAHVRGLVDERRACREAQRAAKPPAYIGNPPQEIHNFMLNHFWGIQNLRQLEDEGRVIRGIGASGGVVEGVARVVLKAEEFGRVQGGEVLVVPSTNPAWTPVFSKIAAVVTDQGGSLSHAAIVAREYGIPAVLGTHTATRRIAEGARIRVDGTKGEVTIL